MSAARTRFVRLGPGTTLLARLPLVALLASPLGACDPVQQDKIDGLGGEAPGVPHGPLHRPGQPCTLCHDGAVGNPEAFSVAGTVYQRPADTVGLNGATVKMTDSTGSTYSTTTNAAGNFYVDPASWTPTYPIVGTQIKSGRLTVQMYTRIGWAGSCATCHVAPAGSTSPGRIVMQLDDGGAPP